ncbi:MAG: hypothetical protein QOE70_474 [Chthoniobacter sp.]|jgi:hypothetical protein|nr:hypothetical protein [Chthoniobacter sp.]
MTAVALQRCLHHEEREAVARCAQCGQFFCRECITEHDERIICAPCLKKLAEAGARARRQPWNLWPAAQLAGGFLLAWVVFYLAGLMLLSLPDEFHNDRLWQERVINAFQGDDDE